MKLNLSFYVPYGPVGHPDAAPMPMFLGQDKEDVERGLYSYLSKRCAQNSVPTVFFDDDKSLEENGYFVLLVRNDEIKDTDIAALPRPAMFMLAAPGAPGRKLEHFRSHISGFYQHFDYEIWEPGRPHCDHDFGLESYRGAFKEKWTGKVLQEDESAYMDTEGSFYVTVTCSRCGAVHALEEMAVE